MTSSQPQRASTRPSLDRPCCPETLPIPLPWLRQMEFLCRIRVSCAHIDSDSALKPVHMQHIRSFCPVHIYSCVSSTHVSSTHGTCKSKSWMSSKMSLSGHFHFLKPQKREGLWLIGISLSTTSFLWASRSSVWTAIQSNISVCSASVLSTHQELNKCLLIKGVHFSTAHFIFLWWMAGVGVR